MHFFTQIIGKLLNCIKIGMFVKKMMPIFLGTGKSLSKAFLFAEHGENILRTKIILNVGNNFCTQHILPRVELVIFMS